MVLARARRPLQLEALHLDGNGFSGPLVAAEEPRRTPFETPGLVGNMLTGHLPVITGEAEIPRII